MYHNIVSFDRRTIVCNPDTEENVLKRHILIVLLLVSLLSPAFASGYVPTESEVKVAIRSIIVAAASTMAARNFTPPLVFSESVFASDGSYASFSLRMQDADVGHLRKEVLALPPPPPRQMGFLEALMSSVIRVVPEHERLIAFLLPQGLLPQEVYFTGYVKADRYAAPYPFRYEGSGNVAVSGKRFAGDFVLDFSFVVPLEGPDAMVIVPLRITANDTDFLPVMKDFFAPATSSGVPQSPGY